MFIKKWEKIWVAITYAEAGEFEESKKYVDREEEELTAVSSRPILETA